VVTLFLLAHRVVGWVDDIDDQDKPIKIPVTRILVQNNQSWIIATMTFFAGYIDQEDEEGLRELGDHYSQWSDVVEAYNGPFDKSDFEAFAESGG
jgi:hypothetical protein